MLKAAPLSAEGNTNVASLLVKVWRLLQLVEQKAYQLVGTFLSLPFFFPALLLSLCLGLFVQIHAMRKKGK